MTVKKKTFIAVAVVLLLVLGIVACTNRPTESNKLGSDQSFANFEMTAHEWVLLEYMARYCSGHYEQVLRSNLLRFTNSRGQFDRSKATSFVVANMHLFADADLLNEIIGEARSMFGISDNLLLPNPFTAAGRGRFFGHGNWHSGVNLFRSSTAEASQYYDSFVRPLLILGEGILIGFHFFSGASTEAFVGLLTAIGNGTLPPDFKAAASFGVNAYDFYNSLNIDMPGFVEMAFLTRIESERRGSSSYAAELAASFAAVANFKAASINAALEGIRHHIDGQSYTMTMHEWIMLEYTKRYCFAHYESTILANSHLFLIDGEVDEYLATKFVIDNLHLFGDSLLYAQVLNEALNEFMLPSNMSNIPIAFSQESKRLLLDYENKHSGINIYSFCLYGGIDTLMRHYKKYLASAFNEHEAENYLAMIGMLETAGSISEIITFLESTAGNPNFTPTYQTIHSFALNNSRFYNSGALQVNGVPIFEESNAFGLDGIKLAIGLDVVSFAGSGVACYVGTRDGCDCKTLVDCMNTALVTGALWSAIGAKAPIKTIKKIFKSIW